MNYKNFILLCLFLSPLLDGTSNWGAADSANTNRKQHINFYGTLVTHQGQTETVDEILIEGKNNDIIMYDAPMVQTEEVVNSKTNQKEVKLSANPISDFIKSKIDLKTIKSLEVIKPNVLWIYQKGKKNQRREFLLVTITEKETNKPKEYLLEHKTRLQCNGTDNNSSQKKEVPLSAIKILSINGYGLTLMNNKKNIKKENDIQCPVLNSKTETTTELIVK